MAKDVLAILVSSVGVERLFSMARDVIIYRRNRFREHTVKNIMIIKRTNWFARNILKNANTILPIIAKKLNQDIGKINDNEPLPNITWATKSKNNNEKSNNDLDFEASLIELNDLNNATHAIAIAGSSRSRDRISTLRGLQACFLANLSLTFLIDRTQDYANNNARKHRSSSHSQIESTLSTYSQNLGHPQLMP